MTKHSAIPSEIVKALLADPAYELVEKGTYLTGKCPACGKRELFISKEKPWVLKCNRLNRCDWSASTRELYPELFENYARRFPASIEEPNKTADSYLALHRGFDLSKIRNFYSQAVFHDSATGKSYPSIRFSIPDTNNAKWEYIISNSSEEVRKANFIGNYAGAAWPNGDFTPQKGDKIFIVEGIFHATALRMLGFKAIAALSAANFPSEFIETHKEKGIEWVLALDGDNAGRSYIKKHATKLKQLGEIFSVCLLPDDGKDWDDLYREKKITDKFIKERTLEGRIFLAPTAKEKAYYEYLKKKRSTILLESSNAIYSISIPKRELQKRLKEADIELTSEKGKKVFLNAITAKRITNITPKLLYIEKDDLLDEQAYIFNISYASGRNSDKVAIDGTHLSEARLFRKALLNKTAGGILHASHNEFACILNQLLEQDPFVIERKRFIGFDPSSEISFFNKLAFHKGKMLAQSKEGFFKLENRGVKTALRHVHIAPTGRHNEDWLSSFVCVFHWQGFACLAFWLGSFFVQQIRSRQKTFPFFELTGEPGAGKSTLLEFLWKCTGRSGYEGFDVMKATESGRRKAFSQLSNLPVVLIESDRSGDIRDAKKKQFDFDECKPFFNGRGTGTLGLPTRDNEVDENMFQASLLISQNLEVDGSEALLERIVHCHADKTHFTPDSLTAARWFETVDIDEVSGFLKQALLNESEILSTVFSNFEELERYFIEAGITNNRIAKNHAQVAACGMALKILFPNTMTEEYEINLKNYLLSRAIKRQQRLKAEDPVVELFWENYEHITSIHNTPTINEKLNHSKDASIIAINLSEYRTMCKHFGLEIPDSRTLKRRLKNSVQRKFIEPNVPIQSRHTGQTKRCWLFKA